MTQLMTFQRYKKKKLNQMIYNYNNKKNNGIQHYLLLYIN